MEISLAKCCLISLKLEIVLEILLFLNSNLSNSSVRATSDITKSAIANKRWSSKANAYDDCDNRWHRNRKRSESTESNKFKTTLAMTLEIIVNLAAIVKIVVILSQVFRL